MPWGGFATWGDVARDSFMVGLTWGLGFGLLALFVSWGYLHLADLWRRSIS
jgi:hypothetical protein